MNTKNLEDKNIKIAHVIGHLFYGGAENQVIQILNGLNLKNSTKFFVYFQEADSENIKTFDNDINIVNIRLKRWEQIPFIYKLYKFFKNKNIDVVQSHMFHANLYVSIAAKFSNVPVIITTDHGMNLWKNPIHHFIERKIISPLSVKRVVVSENIRSIRLRSNDITKNKIEVIPNCVKVPDKMLQKSIKSNITIGTVGRLVSAKDYETLIIAFCFLLKDGIKCELIFVGDGIEHRKLELLVKNLGISEKVTFAGFQSDVEIYLKTFDIFVLSSIREGIPVSMLEAMAFGVPIVATKVGGIPEVIVDQVNGLLVEKRDPKSLAYSLKMLSTNINIRQKIGSNGRKTVKNLFSRETICNRYKELYIDLLKKQAI